ncbi:indolepyruvate ferredoxin oxidoreductase family protein [Rhodococcus sp. DMU1]|uniref:indolepyruvate ferredoxin oxidoreductase family protein n=1 Tax=Rhodococcus sp. DMU1 TaxID=2722825 RepID=UPI00143EE1F9|nr:indolepyruvate ferredoxin oxidoreductase family protein [Rhodococcus sp. DMU1]QIX53872.1 indolepyruvate ferredoxin oxidoreductase family protein [Rhodococcus sp. DMU1]
MGIMDYDLASRFASTSGQVRLSGTDALVRLCLDRAELDAREGLNTAGFVSGYQGSPLAGLDLAFTKVSETLEQKHVTFRAGVNEDLAATAILGTQQVPLLEGARVDGVFGMWFGKGPGVDRSADALKHGNFAGASSKGGVLVVAGDDPGAVSSSLAHQSDHALIHCGIPVLYPSDVQDILKLGQLGWEMSRFSGAWVGMRCVTDVVETTASVDAGLLNIKPNLPVDEFGERHIALDRPGRELERLAIDVRIPAVHAFARANRIDRISRDSTNRRIGIITAGKAYTDLLQALADLGIDEARGEEIGLSIYKVAMVWPLEPEGLREFVDGLDEVLVVEEKRPVLEEQVASILYSGGMRPRLQGKRDTNGRALVPQTGQLSPTLVASVLRRWMSEVSPGVELEAERRLLQLTVASQLERTPAFCSGCPHNTSTNVPEGSIAFGGTGCHAMAVGDPKRRTTSWTHMGGEGATWIGIEPYTETGHVFQNMGDGTYFHSGLLAIRAAVAAGATMTYKILANGVTAMTGGQVIEGESVNSTVIVPDIVTQLLAEHVDPVVVVSDDPSRYKRGDLPRGVVVRHRRDLDSVQEKLRNTPGVSAMVYDQTCAAEARRLRKRDKFPDPDQRVLINELVCEGCGDCSTQSNCIAVEPLETEFGRKRKINQDACNKDFSCLNGYCPSFAVIKGGTLRKPTGLRQDALGTMLEGLPAPKMAECDHGHSTLVAGIGGTGVVTVGAIISMAAHLDGKAATVLDVTGLAQKNGPVTSHVRVAPNAEVLRTKRIGPEMADLILAIDLVVGSSQTSREVIRSGSTKVIVNDVITPTAEFAHSPDLELSPDGMLDLLEETAGAEHCVSFSATDVAARLLGSEVAVNMFMVGYALQSGALPVGLDAINRAIELNGVAVKMNLDALSWGRVYAARQAEVHGLLAEDGAAPRSSEPASLDELVARRKEFLTDYQSRSLAEQYGAFVAEARRREVSVMGSEGPLSRAIAQYLFKLMAYKDEYEVARLYSHPSFRRQLEKTFEGDYKVSLHLAPQFLPADKNTGRVRKVTFGPWIFPLFALLAGWRRFRGTPLDVFGYLPHRRRERALIGSYRETMSRALAQLRPEVYDTVVELASIPEKIRGYGLIKDEAIEAATRTERDLLSQLDAAAVLSRRVS